MLTTGQHKHLSRLSRKASGRRSPRHNNRSDRPGSGGEAEGTAVHHQGGGDIPDEGDVQGPAPGALGAEVRSSGEADGHQRQDARDDRMCAIHTHRPCACSLLPVGF